MTLHRFWRMAVGGAIGILLGGAPLILLAGESQTGVTRPNDKAKPAQSVPGRGFRGRTNNALKAPFPATSGERKAQAEKLLSLYKQIGEAKDVIPAERGRLHARLKSRLVRLADAIALDVKEARSASQSQTGKQPSTAAQSSANRSSTGTDASSPSQTASTGSHGGAPQDDGQALVELIQATIAPQSWDVNGGPGSIVYWPAWHVLVVRQTDDVHEQIGGVMHGMRK